MLSILLTSQHLFLEITVQSHQPDLVSIITILSGVVVFIDILRSWLKEIINRYWN